MMNNIRRFVLLLWVAFPVWLHAQYNIPQNKVWTMSKNAGVDFNTPQPTVITSHVNETECSATVSDNNGALLFYTDGSNVWNSSGTIMPNGLNINGTGTANYTTTQGTLIVPDPGNANRYYLFSMSRYLYLNVVDMTLNNGNGDIVTNYPLKGIICNDTLGEKMIAIRGCNNNIWVVVRGNNRAEFLSFEINSNGINTIPVVSAAGYLPPGNYFQGEMKASPDGKKIITCNTHNVSALELFKFDNASGVVYHPEVLDSNIMSYGAAFSPDGSKVYLADLGDQGNFVQYDLSNNNIRTVLGAAQAVTQVKLAVNGKIYFISAIGSFMLTGNSYLGCINKPNVAGTACLFQDSVSSLSFPNALTSGLLLSLPNEIVVASNGDGGLTNRLMLDTSFCMTEPFPDITLNAFPMFTNYMWDNGTTDPSRIINQGGTYWVNYTTACGRRIDTFKVNANGIPDLQILYNIPVLSANNNYASYQWYQDNQLIPNATSATLSVTDIGWYSLIVTGNNGCSDSASYHITEGATNIDNLYTGSTIIVYPNPVKDRVYVKADVPLLLKLINMEGRVLAEKKGNEMPTNQYAAGIYFLQIRDGLTGRLLQVYKFIK